MRFIFLAMVLLLPTPSALADKFHVTVVGTLTSVSPNSDIYNLDGADFELMFVYDTDARQRSSLTNSRSAISTFDFVEAAYSFSNRPNDAADATVSFGNNMLMNNVHDGSIFNDRFGFPQGGFDSSSEFAGLTAGNGAGLSFGNNTYFSGDVPVQNMPAITSSAVESVHFTNYVFFDSVIRYNFESANLVSILPFGIPGDVKRDGEVNFFDIAPFVELLFSGRYQEEADINQDDSLNFLDVTPFIDLIRGG